MSKSLLADGEVVPGDCLSQIEFNWAVRSGIAGDLHLDEVVTTVMGLDKSHVPALDTW